MTLLHELEHIPALDPDTSLVRVIIDTPRGSRNKFKLDTRLGLFRLSKVLPLGACFPYDFGFIPSTRGDDGDALDVLVLMDEPAFAGCLVDVCLLGVIRAEQTEKGKTVSNDRLVGTVQTPYNPPEARDLQEVFPRRLEEIEHFFVSYNEAEGRQLKILGREGPEAAMRLVEEGMRRFQKK